MYVFVRLMKFWDNNFFKYFSILGNFKIYNVGFIKPSMGLFNILSKTF